MALYADRHQRSQDHGIAADRRPAAQGRLSAGLARYLRRRKLTLARRREQTPSKPMPVPALASVEAHRDACRNLDRHSQFGCRTLRLICREHHVGIGVIPEHS